MGKNKAFYTGLTLMFRDFNKDLGNIDSREKRGVEPPKRIPKYKRKKK